MSVKVILYTIKTIVWDENDLIPFDLIIFRAPF